MKLSTVIANMDKTIAGKEVMLADLALITDAGYVVMARMLRINIQELKAIRAHLLTVDNLE